VVPTNSATLPTRLPTDRDDHTNTDIDTHISQHTIPTHSATPTGIEQRIHPSGEFTPRIELARPHRLQIYMSHLHRDTPTQQPNIHPQETTAEPC